MRLGKFEVSHSIISFITLYFCYVIESEPVIVRRISQPKPVIETEEPEAARRTPSPPRRPKSNIVHIKNLVRPFTLGQLKELLGRTGKFDDEAFWIDKIKSHCIVSVSLWSS